MDSQILQFRNDGIMGVHYPVARPGLEASPGCQGSRDVKFSHFLGRDREPNRSKPQTSVPQYPTICSCALYFIHFYLKNVNAASLCTHISFFFHF